MLGCTLQLGGLAGMIWAARSSYDSIIPVDAERHYLQIGLLLMFVFVPGMLLLIDCLQDLQERRRTHSQ